MTLMFENKQYIAVMAGHGLPDAPAFAPPPGTPVAPPPSGTPAVKPRLYVYVLDERRQTRLLHPDQPDVDGIAP